MKNHRPKTIYGRLPGETYTTNLGIVENFDEYMEIIDEYKNVFGPYIKFITVPTSKKEYAEAKAKAFANLFSALYGPVVNVLVTTIQIKRR